MENDQERRTILAVGLSLLIYMVYIQWFAPPIQTVATVTDVQSVSVAQNGVVGTTIDDAAQATGIGEAEAVEPTDEEPVVKQQLIADHEIPFASDTFEGELHSREGGLRSVHLKNYNKHPEVKALYSWVFDKFSGEGDEWKAYEGGDRPRLFWTIVLLSWWLEVEKSVPTEGIDSVEMGMRLLRLVRLNRA